MRRPPINITPLNRVRRIAIGEGAGLIALLLMIMADPTRLTAAFEALLLLLAFDLMVTGTLGHARGSRRRKAPTNKSMTPL